MSCKEGLGNGGFAGVVSGRRAIGARRARRPVDRVLVRIWMCWKREANFYVGLKFESGHRTGVVVESAPSQNRKFAMPLGGIRPPHQERTCEVLT